MILHKNQNIKKRILLFSIKNSEKIISGKFMFQMKISQAMPHILVILKKILVTTETSTECH